jgi:hypothetical protein
MRYIDFFVESGTLRLMLEYPLYWKVAILTHIYYKGNEILYGNKMAIMDTSPWKPMLTYITTIEGKIPIITFN